MSPHESEEKKAFKRSEWAKAHSEILEEVKSMGPWPCDCGRGPITTIVGCDRCWEEMSASYEQTLRGKYND